LVDGAIIAENPSMYSALFARELNPTTRTYVRVVSLGSGYRSSFKEKSFISGEFIKQLFSGADEMIDLFNYIKAKAHSYFTRILVGNDNYYRFDIELQKGDESYNLADGSSIPHMKTIGQALLETEKKRLKKLVELLVDENLRF
jgi:hypothetical protein